MTLEDRLGAWQVTVRWAVGPLIAVGVLVGRALGFTFPAAPILWIAGAVVLYNVVLLWFHRRGSRMAVVEMMADYVALLTLLHFTGGVASPLVLFTIFHVIIAATLFSLRFAGTLAAVFSAGLWLMLIAQLRGFIVPTEITFRGEVVHAFDRPVYAVSMLLLLTATLFMVTLTVGHLMHRFRERVEELIEERTRFMLESAHNLRAPLAAGLSLLGLVRDGDLGPLNDKQADTLGRLRHRLVALHQMIGELLTIAKLRDWSREITDVVVDLRELARHTGETFEQQAARKGVRLTIHADESLPAIDSGADLLDKLMENLVSNAIKYTPADGSVDVRFTRLEPNRVRIVVEDTGIGIPKREQSKLFDEFFRASNAKRATAAGTGLGLALVRKTVERHRGTVRVESEEDRGTKVVIDLPIRQLKRAWTSTPSAGAP